MATRPGITILLGEGVATVLSAKEGSGHLVVAALSSGNLLAVAKAMRERYPAAKRGILGDLGPGQKDAEEAARATESALILPAFGEDRPDRPQRPAPAPGPGGGHRVHRDADRRA
jgi:putative DNA primase/helicase